MLKANIIIASKTSSVEYQNTITLEFEQRYKRRCLMKTDQGIEFLLDLPQTTVLSQGSILQLSNNTLVEIKLAEEEILDIQSTHLTLLLKCAWYLGNMHCPIEIRSNNLRIRYDPVIEKELKKEDIILKHHKSFFNPEINLARSNSRHEHL